MPRLTNTDYLHHRDLIGIERRQPVFFRMSIREQRDLLDFYGSGATLNDEGAIARRRIVSAEQPSLPHRAGKAYAHLLREMEHLRILHASRPHRVGRTKRDFTVRVMPELRENVDFEKLARILLDIAKERAEHGNTHSGRRPRDRS